MNHRREPTVVARIGQASCDAVASEAKRLAIQPRDLWDAVVTAWMAMPQQERDRLARKGLVRTPVRPMP